MKMENRKWKRGEFNTEDTEEGHREHREEGWMAERKFTAV
jgi:hypothetical protein